MAQPLVLKPDAASLPPSACRILGCEGHIGNGKGARGLCSRHHGAAHKAGRLEELALPPTTTRRPKQAPPIAEPEPRLSQEERRIAAEQAHQEELAQRQAECSAAPKNAPGAPVLGALDRLHAERDAAIAKVAELEQRVTQIQAERDGVGESERDLLDESINVAHALGIDTGGDYDLLVRAREVMAELVQLRAERAKALSLDQHPPATIQRPGLPALPEPKPHRVKQAGGRDLGVLVGYTDANGLFRVTGGPLAGAAYGCLYSAEPVERPELGEPETGATVWVRTSIDEVTAASILTSDGGRIPRAEWGPGRFVRRQAGPTTRIAWQPAPTVADDDLPF